MPSSGLSRRGLVQGAAALLASRLAAAPRRPPNIVFVLADDLGWGDLGCYNQQFVATPRLDRLAAEGTRFTDAYAGSTVCAPSRCCLMTGLHTGHARIRGNALVPLRPDDLTVAELLRRAGYATGLFGKWGLGEPGTSGVPTRKGFDEFFGYLNQVHAHNYYPSYLWRGEERVPLENVVPNERPDGGGVASVKKQYSHDLIVTEALDFIRRHQDRPFFLYLATTIPHANNEAGREGMEVPELGQYADAPWPPAERARAAMITRLDRDVGRLVDRLDELGLGRDTVVFFSSDNGPHREGGSDPEVQDANGPLRGIKRDLYEGGIRVPMIVRWPGRVPAGRVSSVPWAFWDVLPTAAELAGVPAPAGLDGVSVLPALLGERLVNPPPYQYWEFGERGFEQAVRLDRWKAVRHARTQPVELYDLTCDLGEARDLAATMPELARQLGALMDAAHVDSREFPIRERGAR